MVEVFKVVTRELSTSYHGSKEAALRRAEQDVMRYSKDSNPNVVYLSKVYRAQFDCENAREVVEDLQLGKGRWHWPECNDLIAKQSSRDGGVTYLYDDEEGEDRGVTAMRRVFVDDMRSFQKMRSELCIEEFTGRVRQTAMLYRPLLTPDFHKEVSAIDEKSSLADLSDYFDVLCGDVYSALDDPDQVVMMAHRVYEFNRIDMPDPRFKRLAASLLKAMLDAREQ